MTLTVETLDPRHAPELAADLRTAGLPADDLDEPGRIFFAFNDENGLRCGYVGAEWMGEDALLRSVVVLPLFRGRGHGRRIMEWMLGWLNRAGAHELYLLTDNVVPMMEKFGFRAIDRAAAPARVRATRQFSSQCPITAVLMHRPAAQE